MISMVANTGRRMKTSAKRMRASSGAGRGVGAHHDRRAVGELGEPARHHLHAACDSFRDLDPPVAEVDAEHDLSLVREPLLDYEPLPAARQRARGTPAPVAR